MRKSEGSPKVLSSPKTSKDSTPGEEEYSSLRTVLSTQGFGAMIASCTVVLKLCSKDPLWFFKVVSKMVREGDTHPYIPHPHS